MMNIKFKKKLYKFAKTNIFQFTIHILFMHRYQIIQSNIASYFTHNVTSLGKKSNCFGWKRINGTVQTFPLIFSPVWWGGRRQRQVRSAATQCEVREVGQTARLPVWQCDSVTCHHPVCVGSAKSSLCPTSSTSVNKM